MKSIKKMSKYQPVSHLLQMTFGTAKAMWPGSRAALKMSALNITAASLRLPKRCIHVKNVKAAVLTSLI